MEMTESGVYGVVRIPMKIFTKIPKYLILEDCGDVIYMLANEPERKFLQSLGIRVRYYVDYYKLQVDRCG